MSTRDDHPQAPDWPRIIGVVAAALLAAFLFWLLLIRGDDDEESSGAAAARSAPVATTESRLESLADRLGHPIYWAGEEQGATLELTRTSSDDIYVRYLTDGEIGDSRADFLTVGTYPFPDALQALEEVANADGSLVSDTPDGGVVVTNEETPTSVYIAYPDEDLQIEVYDPDPERAFELATSGDIVPVE